MMKFIIFLFLMSLPFVGYAQDKTSLYAYETAKGMTVGAIFGQLPPTDVTDELISASSPVCGSIEIHIMSEDDGIMRMRKVPSLPLKANETKVLEPLGYHLMLMKLTKPLENGDVIPLTLVFKKTGTLTINVPVLTRQKQVDQKSGNKD